MCVTIFPRADLEQKQVEHLSKRAAASEHANDNGPLKAWDQRAAESMLHAIIIPVSPMPIGILYGHFMNTELEVGWWVDIEWRSKKFTRPAVAAFGELLKLKHSNFTGKIHAPIMTFGGNYDEKSRALLKEFMRVFFDDGIAR